MMRHGDVVATREGEELVYDGTDVRGRTIGYIRRDGVRHLPPQPLIVHLSRGGWEPAGSALAAAGVRHVRTPEGAAKFGQPIGAVIKVDTHAAKARVTHKRTGDLALGDRFYDFSGALREVIKDRSPGYRDDPRRFTTLTLSGSRTGHVEMVDWDPDVEVTVAPPTPADPFMADVLVPARIRLAELAKKYPEGIPSALEAVLTDAGPEPQTSDEMKRLWRETVANWEMQRMPAARAELEEARTAQMKVPGWITGEDSPQAKKARRRVDAAVAAVEALLPENVPDVARYQQLLTEHRAEYEAWLRRHDKKQIRSDAAREILKDVESVGADIYRGIQAQISRAQYTRGGDSVDGYTERRRLARRVVAELAGTATSTIQTWESVYDPDAWGFQRALEEREQQMLTESLLFYPAGWVRDFDFVLRQVTTDKSRRGYFSMSGTQPHLALSDFTNAGPLDGHDMQQTAVHEIGHGMEKAVRGLAELETIFWWQRMGTEDPVLLPFDTSTAPRREDVGLPTANPYTLKWYGDLQPSPLGASVPQSQYRVSDADRDKVLLSWEVFTTGVQEVLGSGKRDLTLHTLNNDHSLWDFTMGAMLTLPGGTMKVGGS